MRSSASVLAKNAEHPSVPERVDKDLMEVHIGFDQPGCVAFREECDHVGCHGAQLADALLGAALECGELDEAPDLEDLTDILRVKGGHDRSLVDAVLDEAFSLEPADAFAHRIARHAHGLGQADLTQGGPGGEFAAKDESPQLIGHLIDGTRSLDLEAIHWATVCHCAPSLIS